VPVPRWSMEPVAALRRSSMEWEATLGQSPFRYPAVRLGLSRSALQLRLANVALRLRGFRPRALGLASCRGGASGLRSADAACGLWWHCGALRRSGRAPEQPQGQPPPSQRDAPPRGMRRQTQVTGAGTCGRRDRRYWCGAARAPAGAANARWQGRRSRSKAATRRQPARRHARPAAQIGPAVRRALVPL
jgi:hypothetical protein